MTGLVRDEGDCLYVSGRMTLSEATELLTDGVAALTMRSEQKRLNEAVFDLSRVEAVDSSAISIIFAWLRAAGRKEQRIRIIHPSHELLSLADVYGVGDLLPLNRDS